ncbi:MAG: hypothetical protein EP344_03740 [Bacteroidetes bacterium]|nr:MAG: hypothetical protein EP344_03740 [Bacteroidota bacterium]
MAHTSFTPTEQEEILALFGALPDQLDADTFHKTLRSLRQKYHPDNFEKFGDETIREMATDRFQRLERLAAKLERYFRGDDTASGIRPGASGQTPADPIFHPQAQFAYRAMKIEIRTGDKDLKYRIFGTFYRWLMLGEQFKIPETGAYLIADEEHQGHRIGFRETIRVYLTFEETDPPETIAHWLADQIADGADALLIEGEIVPIEYEAILLAIKRRSFQRLGTGA